MILAGGGHCFWSLPIFTQSVNLKLYIITFSDHMTPYFNTNNEIPYGYTEGMWTITRNYYII